VTTTPYGTGAGTLRTAIAGANANPGLDTITFSIPGSGQQNLPITSSLPAITDPVIIDGTTQPGYAGTPLIRFTPGASGVASLINITGGGSTIKALAFASFSGITTNNGMIVLASNNNVVTACHSGTGSGNTQVYITGANNRVGGSIAADRNFFYGNTSSRENVIIRGLSATGNRVTGNVFGTTPAGVRQTNSGKHILIEDAPNNFVGGTLGTTPGGPCSGECNVLSGSDNDAVAIFGAGSTGNVVAGNYIGMMADGLNVNRNANYGVHIQNASNNTLGGNTDTSRNVVAANTFGQIWVESGTGNVIIGNYVGLKVNGTESVTGTFNVPAFGIQLNSNNNRVGGDTTGERNIISGSNRGVIINGNDNRVRGNYIGTDATGTIGLTTQFDGVLVNGSNNTIGGSNGTTPAGPCTGACNVISGNAQNTFNHGVAINGPSATGNKVTGNMIGLNAAGTAAICNAAPDGSGFGKAILVNNASNNTIGGLPPSTSEPTNLGPVYTHCIQSQSGEVKFRYNVTNGRWLYLDCENEVAYSDPPLFEYQNNGSKLVLPGLGEAIVNPFSPTATVNFTPPSNPRYKRSFYDSDTNNNGTCECPPKTDNNPVYVPPQTIVGSVEIGGPNGSTLILFAGNRVGMSSNGSTPLFAVPDKILVNGTSNLITENDIASQTNAIELLNPNNTAIDNDFDSYVQDWTPLLTTNAARALVFVFRVDNHYEIVVRVFNGLPNTQYRFDVFGKTPFPNSGIATDALFDGVITTDESGAGSIRIGASGELQPFTAVGSTDLTASVTQVVSTQGPQATSATYGATSPFSSSVHVPGTPVSGRVTTPAGQGLRNAIVVLVDTVTGGRRTATTSSFGFFSFDDVLALRTYTLTVSSRQFRFAPQSVFVLDTMPNISLVGLE